MESDAQRFDRYVDAISDELGHADRVAPFRAYCTGLLLPGERKSVEPLAARVGPTSVRKTHQSLHHFVSTSSWDDQAVLLRVGQLAIPVLEAREPVRSWIVDDTGIPKKGKHSVGVAHQYCGQLGKRIARLPSVYPLPTRSQACRLRIVCIYRSLGLTIPKNARRPACRTTSALRPSNRFRWAKSGAHWQPAFRRASSPLMQRTAMTRTFATNSAIST